MFIGSSASCAAIPQRLRLSCKILGCSLNADINALGEYSYAEGQRRGTEYTLTARNPPLKRCLITMEDLERGAALASTVSGIECSVVNQTRCDGFVMPSG